MPSGRDRGLRQQAERAGDLLGRAAVRWPCRRAAPCPRVGVSSRASAAQQRGLAAGVGADDRGDLAGGHVEVAGRRRPCGRRSRAVSGLGGERVRCVGHSDASASGWSGRAGRAGTARRRAGDDADRVAVVERRTAPTRSAREHEQRADQRGRHQQRRAGADERAGDRPGDERDERDRSGRRRREREQSRRRRRCSEQPRALDARRRAPAAVSSPSCSIRSAARPARAAAARARRSASASGSDRRPVAPLRLPVSQLHRGLQVPLGGPRRGGRSTTLSSIAATPMPIRISRVPATPPRYDEQVDRRARSTQRADEREDRDRASARARARRSPNTAAALAPDADADDVGAGERVAQHGLEDGAGDAEREARRARRASRAAAAARRR